MVTRSAIRYRAIQALACMLLVGCAEQRNAARDADSLVARHFELLQKGEVDKAMEQYSYVLFKQPKRNRERWKESLAKLSGTNNYTVNSRVMSRRDGGTVVDIGCRTQ